MGSDKLSSAGSSALWLYSHSFLFSLGVSCRFDYSPRGFLCWFLIFGAWQCVPLAFCSQCPSAGFGFIDLDAAMSVEQVNNISALLLSSLSAWWTGRAAQPQQKKEAPAQARSSEPGSCRESQSSTASARPGAPGADVSANQMQRLLYSPLLLSALGGQPGQETFNPVTVRCPLETCVAASHISCMTLPKLLVSKCLLSACLFANNEWNTHTNSHCSLFLVSARHARFCGVHWKNIEGGCSSIADLHGEAWSNPWEGGTFWLWKAEAPCVHQQNSWELLLSLSLQEMSSPLSPLLPPLQSPARTETSKLPLEAKVTQPILARASDKLQEIFLLSRSSVLAGGACLETSLSSLTINSALSWKPNSKLHLVWASL